jgi:hypothetical protein
MALLDQLDGLFTDLARIPGLPAADKAFLAEKRAAIPGLLAGVEAVQKELHAAAPAPPERLRGLYDVLAAHAARPLASFESLVRALEKAAALCARPAGAGGANAFPSAAALNDWGLALDRMSPRVPGTEAMDRTTEYLVKELSDFGLETWTEPLDFRGVFFREWSFSLCTPTRRTFVSFPQNNVGFGDVEAALADVGRGRESDYANADVKGKIVLVNWGRLWEHEGPCAARQRYGILRLYDLAWAYGAAGMVGYFEDTPGNSLKILEPGVKPMGGSNVFGPSEAGPDHRFKLPVLHIGRADALEIKALLRRAGANPADGPATARLTIRGVRKVSRTQSVLGFLPGRSAKTIAVAAHACTAFEGAICDTVGVVGALALAKHFASLPIAERGKSFLFFFDSFHVWGNCCQTANMVLRQHPTLAAEIDAFVWLDHISDGRADTERLLLSSEHPVVWPLAALATARRGVPPCALPIARVWSLCATGAFERRGVPTLTMQALGDDVLTTEDTWDKFDLAILRRDILIQAEIVGALLQLDVPANPPAEPIGGCGALFTETETPAYPPGAGYEPEPSYPLYIGGGTRPVRILADEAAKARHFDAYQRPRGEGAE